MSRNFDKQIDKSVTSYFDRVESSEVPRLSASSFSLCQAVHAVGSVWMGSACLVGLLEGPVRRQTVGTAARIYIVAMVQRFDLAKLPGNQRCCRFGWAKICKCTAAGGLRAGPVNKELFARASTYCVLFVVLCCLQRGPYDEYSQVTRCVSSFRNDITLFFLCCCGGALPT